MSQIVLGEGMFHTICQEALSDVYRFKFWSSYFIRPFHSGALSLVESTQ